MLEFTQYPDNIGDLQNCLWLVMDYPKITVSHEEIWMRAKGSETVPNFSNVYISIVFERLAIALSLKYPKTNIRYTVNMRDSVFYVDDIAIESYEQMKEIVNAYDQMKAEEKKEEIANIDTKIEEISSLSDDEEEALKAQAEEFTKAILSGAFNEKYVFHAININQYRVELKPDLDPINPIDECELPVDIYIIHPKYKHLGSDHNCSNLSDFKESNLIEENDFYIPICWLDDEIIAATILTSSNKANILGYAVYKPSEDLPPEKCLDENGKLTDEGKIYAVDTIRNTLAYWNRYIRGEIYEVTIYEDCNVVMSCGGFCNATDEEISNSVLFYTNEVKPEIFEEFFNITGRILKFDIMKQKDYWSDYVSEIIFRKFRDWKKEEDYDIDNGDTI